VTGSRWEFTPTVATWDFTFSIYKNNSDGSRTLIETKTFANTDSPAWAESGEPGVWKRTDYATSIDPSSGEGVHVEIDSTGIGYLYGDLKFTVSG
jgi:hypothetical protein